MFTRHLKPGITCVSAAYSANNFVRLGMLIAMHDIDRFGCSNFNPLKKKKSN